MDTMVCAVCTSREPDAFADREALLCVECAARWAICLECEEPFALGESATDVRCDACLAVHRLPARIAA
jgi:hypothetical protein